MLKIFLPDLGGSRYYQLDTLRFFFAVVVVAVHFGYNKTLVPSGGLAVDFFFVLSGFVIAPWILRTNIGFSDFAWRRFARMYPLHIVTLFAVLAIYLFTGNNQVRQYPEGNLFTFVSHLLLLQNMGLNENLAWNWPSWSISVELWLNILFLYFLVRYKMTVAAVIVVIASYSLLYMDKGAFSYLHNQLVGGILQGGMVRCLGGLALGYLCYLSYQAIKAIFGPATSRLGRFIEFLCWTFVECLFIAGAIYFVTKSPDQDQFVAVAMMFVMIITFALGRGGVSALLSIRALSYLGDLSYAIYLTHGPLIILSRRLGYPVGKDQTYTPEHLIVYGVTLLFVSIVSYHIIEMKGKDAVMAIKKRSQRAVVDKPPA